MLNIATLDFETYSEAGFIWDEENKKYYPPHGSDEKGLQAVGLVAYAEHPTTRILSCAYDLNLGEGVRHFIPDVDKGLPIDLFNHVIRCGLIEAWNAAFEWWIWNTVGVKRYGFPSLQIDFIRCAMAKSRAFALPGSLDAAGEVLNIKHKKDKRGKQLIQKFCIPSPQLQAYFNDAQEYENFKQYNIRDVEAEKEISNLIPFLNAFEQEFWYYDRLINIRGVQIDLKSIDNCIKIIEQAYAKYEQKLAELTNNIVTTAGQVKAISNWLALYGINTTSVDKKHVANLLADENLPDQVRQVLKIRELLSSSSIKKLYAMKNQASSKGRLHELFMYHGARTGRATGNSVQPHNLPRGNIDVMQCNNCNAYSRAEYACYWCGKITDSKKIKWNHNAVEHALNVINTGSLEVVELFFGNALETISACLRGLFISRDGYDLICADYKSIEAVVLAALAGEEWRLEVFRTHGMIYEMSASKITGIAFDEFIKHKEKTGSHHPSRDKIGKIAELASGFQGWIGAWKQAGADEFLSEEEIKTAILAWREASPAIVQFWYALENAAHTSVLNPGKWQTVRNIKYVTNQDILYCILPSGRFLTYHKPRLSDSAIPGKLSLSFEGWNSNPLKGKVGWTRIDTYGGKLTENVVQAVARDILANAIINLEKANYPVVLHVHDEICAEINSLDSEKSEANFMRIMEILPTWAATWPIKATGGWRGKRYRK